jgi:hypothetical protein
MERWCITPMREATLLRTYEAGQLYVTDLAANHTIGGFSFNGESAQQLGGKVYFKAVGTYSSADVTSNMFVELWDLGPGGASVPLKLSTLEFLYADVGTAMIVELELAVDPAPTLDNDMIYDVTRIYEVQVRVVSAGDATATGQVNWCGLEVRR